MIENMRSIINFKKVINYIETSFVCQSINGEKEVNDDIKVLVS